MFVFFKIRAKMGSEKNKRVVSYSHKVNTCNKIVLLLRNFNRLHLDLVVREI